MSGESVPRGALKESGSAFGRGLMSRLLISQIAVYEERASLQVARIPTSAQPLRAATQNRDDRFQSSRFILRSRTA